jgi:alpha-galactosidase
MLGISPSFSFLYERMPSSAYLKGLSYAVEYKKLDENRTRIIKTWSDAVSGLQVRCVIVEYTDFPAVEWTLYFKNTGKMNTGMLQDIRCLDTVFRRGGASEFVLYGNKGEWCAPQSYEPYEMVLGPGAERRCAPQMGSLPEGLTDGLITT